MKSPWKLSLCAIYGAIIGLGIKLLVRTEVAANIFAAFRDGNYGGIGGPLVELVGVMAVCAGVGVLVGIIRNLSTT
jgi:hypothetical protein